MRIDRRRIRRLVLAATIGGVLVATAHAALDGATPRFFTDDPLAREPETADASHVKSQTVDLLPDLMLNMFVPTGDQTLNARARDINTIDEVPDSNWFTNRIYSHPMTADDVARGPDTGPGPVPGRWTVISAKIVGDSGFTVRDSAGAVWFVQCDPKGYPHASTAAVAVAVRLFWALGYYQVESYISHFRPELLDIDPKTMVAPRPWRKRPMTRSDINLVLRRAAPEPDGSYRVIAGRLISGTIVGPFVYYGTRADDPNDLVPHEHRRSLRALKVFGAWTNLNDMKAGNTLDSLIEENGRHVVRHYLQDVGSTFGAGANGPREWDEGYEFLYELHPALKRMKTLNFYLSPWQTIPYKVLPEVGRFEGDRFDPDAWVPRVPMAAFLRARPDDTFWAALRVAAFTDDQVRAAVHAGEYSDPAAERLLGDILIKRRDKIARAYLPKITPLTRFALSDGVLTFDNAAVRLAGSAPPDGGYRAEWFAFDNATDEARPIGEASTGTTESLTAPTQLASSDGAYVKVAVTAPDSHHPSWSQPVNVYFHRTGGGWTLVGVERLADGK